jgi:hypothetical protein
MVFIEVGGSILMAHPGGGILVSLGLENVLDWNSAIICYNYVALGIIFFIAAMASSRNEARYCILIPLIAGLFTGMGWLHAPDPLQSFAVIVICGLLGVMIYMAEQSRERYGTKGPGSRLLSIVIFIILFQVALGFTSSLNLFAAAPTQVPVSQCSIGNESVLTNCDAYGNIQLSAVRSVSSSGGLLADIVSVAMALATMALTLLQFIIQIGIAIIGAPFLIASTISGLFCQGVEPAQCVTSNGAYVAFMVGIGAVFYLADIFFLLAAIVKPFPGQIEV